MASKKGSSGKHSQRVEPPQQPRHSTFFVDGAGIDREVITADICRYLGNDALVRPGPYTNRNTGEVIQGFFVTGYRALTSKQLENLRADSARWAAERTEKSQNTPSSRGPSTSSEGYGQSATAAARAQRGFPQEMGPPPLNEPEYSDRGGPSYMSSMSQPNQSPSYEQQQRYGNPPQPPINTNYVSQDYQSYSYDNPITAAYEVNRNPQGSQQPRTTFPSSGVGYAPESRAPVYSPSTSYYPQAAVPSGRGQPQQQPQQQPPQQPDYVVTPPPQLMTSQPQSYYPGRAPPQPTYNEPQDDEMDYDEPDPVPVPTTATQSHTGSRREQRERDSERDRRRKDHR